MKWRLFSVNHFVGGKSRALTSVWDRRGTHVRTPKNLQRGQLPLVSVLPLMFLCNALQVLAIAENRGELV